MKGEICGMAPPRWDHTREAKEFIVAIDIVTLERLVEAALYYADRVLDDADRGGVHAAKLLERAKLMKAAGERGRDILLSSVDQRGDTFEKFAAGHPATLAQTKR